MSDDFIIQEFRRRQRRAVKILVTLVCVYVAGMAGMFALLALGRKFAVAAISVFVASVLLSVAGAIWAILTRRCPACKAFVPIFLSGNVLRFCPHCGRQLRQDPRGE